MKLWPHGVQYVSGLIHKYDTSKTPYHRLLESSEITKKKKQELKEIYHSLNPAQLKRTIDERLKELHKINQKVDVKM